VITITGSALDYSTTAMKREKPSTHSDSEIAKPCFLPALIAAPRLLKYVGFEPERNAFPFWKYCDPSAGIWLEVRK
jgi:hypothetical protein